MKKQVVRIGIYVLACMVMPWLLLAQSAEPPVLPQTLPMPGEMPAEQGNASSPDVALPETQISEEAAEAVAPEQEISVMEDTVVEEEATMGLQASLPQARAIIPPQYESSMGDFGISLMFAPEDILNIQRVLSVYEEQLSRPTQMATDEPKNNESDILSELLRNMQGGEQLEEQPLPVFYLSSIIYRNPSDWSVWVNGKRLTSRKNEHEALEGLRVRTIDKQRVKLGWQPVQLAPALRVWQQVSNDENYEHPFRHRQANDASIEYVLEDREFVITMRPNQSFVGAEMALLEGSYKPALFAPSPEQLDDLLAQPGALSGRPATSAEAISNALKSATFGTSQRQGTMNERALSNELLDNLQTIQQFIPVRAK